MKRALAALLLSTALAFSACAQPGTTYRNPIIYADYSDPDMIRTGEDYWMTASSFNCIPGLQILHSRNLVEWELVGAALPDGPEAYWDKAAGTPVEWYGSFKLGAFEGITIEMAGDKEFSSRPVPDAAVQHGNGVWAPSIRYHDGLYWIFWGDPDYGIYQVHAADPRGEWSEPVRVIAGKGFIDPCPLWDDDGRVWLVHAWANSRCGIKSVLHVCELNADCTACISDQVRVFDGRENGQTTVEGPKFYKKDGWYWIFAPAGGVKTGWQIAMRSREVLGPYEYKVVMEQGATDICGPHQGGWVTDTAGDDWFLHFEDRYAWGRVVHLQPMVWGGDGWPVIGEDSDGDGIGNPVAQWTRPASSGTAGFKGTGPTPPGKPGKVKPRYLSRRVRSAVPGGLLQRQGAGEGTGDNLWNRPELELAKVEGPFMEISRVFTRAEVPEEGEIPIGNGRQGIVVLGTSYSTIEINDSCVVRRTNFRASKGGEEVVRDSVRIRGDKVWLRVIIREGTEMAGQQSSSDIPLICDFQYCFDERHYTSLGPLFQASAGRWIGAKAGAFSLSH